MEGPYGSEWQEEEKVKRREMVDPEARYIFVHEVVNSNADDMTTVLTEEDTSTSRQEDSGPLVGFVHYRFVLEEDVPVLYVYELQLESRVQGKGLGKFLMELIELIAQKVLKYFSQLTLTLMIVENCCYVAENTTYNL
jgi:GNAT superfamily N-acetyltransferase